MSDSASEKSCTAAVVQASVNQGWCSRNQCISSPLRIRQASTRRIHCNLRVCIAALALLALSTEGVKTRTMLLPVGAGGTRAFSWYSRGKDQITPEPGCCPDITVFQRKQLPVQQYSSGCKNVRHWRYNNRRPLLFSGIKGNTPLFLRARTT